MSKALIIFVRKPELGKVKTRLAATVGNEKALTIYKELVAHTCGIAKEIKADKVVFYHEAIEENDCWSATSFYKEVQINSDLGEKMKAAFVTVFAKGYEKVLIIGSDCLQLTTSIVQSAFDELSTNDIVIGPANDGGYYLLGMKKLNSFLFENKKWSTSTVFSDTIADIATNQLTVSVLPQLIDVDTEEDWRLSKTT
jgi:uncharacterized protein